jgi:rubrerythrin
MSSLAKLLLTILLLLGAATFGGALSADSQDYPETTAALQERYADEMIAHQTYGAYARHALEEGYPNIAHLFRALAASEAVHARNFATLLEQLGVQPEMPVVEPQLGDTQQHLQQATEVEAGEIDKGYPAVLQRIQPEGHAAAIEKTTWAWQAEKQHRDLIIKIRDAASTWFGLLVSRIEGDTRHYHVCQVCGSTLDEQPAGTCPICGHRAEEYQEVPWVPAAQVEQESQFDY